MEKIIIYEKPTCTTCRSVSKILLQNSVNFDIVNYYIKPFTKTKLKLLLKKMGMKPSQLLRKNEAVYKKLNIKNNNYSEDDILNLMVNNPDLVQRPIVEKGNIAILARPADKIRELF